MNTTVPHPVAQSIESSIRIHADRERVWENITRVDIENFSDPLIFKLLDIPKPVKAELISTGVGGKRIAYFQSGKKFHQEILQWDPGTAYTFTFNPEKGFTVGYFFDIAEGVFQLRSGAYGLSEEAEGTLRLTLRTDFCIHPYVVFLFILPVRLILRIFQRYLLRSIKSNAERQKE
jgi:hypothetical protein